MEDLILYLKILRRRWFPASIVFITVVLLGFQRATSQVDVYRATGKLLFPNNRGSNVADILALNQQRSNVANDLELINSELLAERVMKDLQLDQQQEDEEELDLLEKINITNIRDTEIIQLSYEDEDPLLASQIVNSWMDNYLAIDLERNLQENRNVATFLEQQLPKSQESLELVTEELKNFKQSNRILDIQAEASSTVQIIGELDKQMATTQTELAALRAKQQSLQQIFQVESKGAVVSSFINESPVAGSLLKELQTLKAKIETEKVRFGDQHPQIIALQREEEVLREQLQNQINNTFVSQTQDNTNVNIDAIVQPGQTQTRLLEEYANTERQVQSLEAQLVSLENLIDDYRQRVNQLPELEFKNQQLQRDIQVRENLVRNLVQNYQDVQISLSKTQGNIQLVERALVPDTPIPSRKILYIAQSFIGGIILASIVALILDKLDKGLKSSESIKQVLPQNVLARVNKFSDVLGKDNTTQIPARDHANSVIAEEYRRLYTTLSFMSTEEQPLDVITISSSVPGEGKSTTAANLATVAAEILNPQDDSGEAKKKVLLIEGDMRKPSQKSIWNYQVEKGLNQYLQSNGRIPFEPLLISGEDVLGVENLDIFPAGGHNNNPVGLIGSPQMLNFIKEQRKNYALIIIDAPPLTVAADAQLFARMSDAMLMVIRQGKATLPVLRASREIMEQANINVAGLVLNCFNRKDQGYGYGYKYGYGKNYGYGYSYGHSNEESKKS